MKARIERGIRDREPRGSVDAAALARLCVTELQGMSIQARDGVKRAGLMATAAIAMRAWPA